MHYAHGSFPFSPLLSHHHLSIPSQLRCITHMSKSHRKIQILGVTSWEDAAAIAHPASSGKQALLPVVLLVQKKHNITGIQHRRQKIQIDPDISFVLSSHHFQTLNIAGTLGNTLCGSGSGSRALLPRLTVVQKNHNITGIKNRRQKIQIDADHLLCCLFLLFPWSIFFLIR